ncbi:MAG: site-specific integrase [Gammaproteobacteria bacterium]
MTPALPRKRHNPVSRPKGATHAEVTKRLVDDTTPTDRDLFVWDSQIAGFGLKVFPSGQKSYVFQYRTPEGRSRRVTIGKHSDTLTADLARAQAKKMRRTVEDGGDPMADRQAARESMTVAGLLAASLESAKFQSKAESTQAIDRGRIKRHLDPTLGWKFVNKLTGEDVRRAFAAIRDGKTAKKEKTGPRGLAVVKGGEGAARMAIRLFKAVMVWAADEGYTSTNPAAVVKVGSDGSRDTILEKPEQYAAMFRVIERMENEKRIRSPVADAIRVIALTGARRGEVAGLRWGHVNLKDGLIKLPPKSHKTGRTTGKPRIIGLPAAAQTIIARQPEGNPDDFVFSPARGEGVVSLARPWRQIRAEAELPAGIGLHGLRHSLASAMAMNGAQAAEIMTALGHRQLSTAQRYIHWAQDSRAALAEKSAAHISAALTGKKKKAQVVQIKKGGRKLTGPRK